MTSQILRVIGIGIVAGATLFFFPFLFRALAFFLFIGLLFRVFSGYRYRRWGRYARYEGSEAMPGSFMSTHYYHRSGITPLYSKPEGGGPEAEIRIH